MDIQNCLSKYPEVYGLEIESEASDDDDEDYQSAHATPEHAQFHTESILPSAYSDPTPAPPSKPASDPTKSEGSADYAPGDKGKQPRLIIRKLIHVPYPPRAALGAKA
jgi:intermembrane space import and assembly protein 40